MRMIRFILGFVIAGSLCISIPSSSETTHWDDVLNEELPDTVVKISRDVEIPEGKDLNGDVVCIMGKADIQGTVQGSLISILGEVRTGPRTVIKGDVVSIYSKTDPSIKAGRSFIDINFMSGTVHKFIDLWKKTIIPNLLLAAVGLILLIVIYLTKVLPRVRPEDFSENLVFKPGRFFLVGLLTAVVLNLAGTLLVFTVVGSGLGILVWAAYGLLWLTGIVGVCIFLGKAVNGLFKASMSVFLLFFIGLIILVLVNIIPVVGWLLNTVLGLMGVGGVVSQMSAPKNEVKAG